MLTPRRRGRVPMAYRRTGVSLSFTQSHRSFVYLTNRSLPISINISSRIIDYLMLIAFYF
ncbi:hypothetical protein BJ165DRAFT_1500750 [Panaeolus papilionaceus]|nr:hypothetical protein BJ165DRAFT_1500750 [Panaeolus papilionaceus]